jgi:hypothetical protein
MLPDQQWAEIVNQLLRGTEGERRAARAAIWRRVNNYVARKARLRAGPLPDDDVGRRDIALRVIETLERDDFAQIREWERRQRADRDAASWWTFVNMIVYCRAVELERASRLDVAHRGESFAWVTGEVTEPHTPADPRLVDARTQHDWLEMLEFLDRFNQSRRVPRKSEPLPEPPESLRESPDPPVPGAGRRRGPGT